MSGKLHLLPSVAVGGSLVCLLLILPQSKHFRRSLSGLRKFCVTHIGECQNGYCIFGEIIIFINCMRLTGPRGSVAHASTFPFAQASMGSILCS